MATGSKHTLFTLEQRLAIVENAKLIKNFEKRQQYLFRVAPLDFPLTKKDKAEKLRYWADIERCGHECSYGDWVDNLIANDVRNALENKLIMNLDVLRGFLEKRCSEYEPSFSLDTCGKLYGKSWAQVFAKRHTLNSKVSSVVGTSFSKPRGGTEQVRGRKRFFILSTFCCCSLIN
jgi:hypothetical protein